MKKSILLLFACIISTVVSAQNLSVHDFKLDESDHTASDDATKQEDQNGDVCAVIKVITNEKGFSFDVGALGVWDTDTTHEGEIWVYVPATIKRITIQQQDYGTCEYEIPIIVESEKTYRMTLNINGVATENDSQHLTFTCDPMDAEVMINDKEVELKNGVYDATLATGVYSYSVEAGGYVPQSGTFELRPNAAGNVTVNLTKITTEEGRKIDWDNQEPIEYTVSGTDIKFKMIPVRPKNYFMGASQQQSDAFEDEYPSHLVHVDGFFIGESEVTQDLWMVVMGSNPARFHGEELPVENVSWNDCQMFISQLNIIMGETFRLPTEAEWELAACADGATEGVGYSGKGPINELAWYGNNSEHTTHTIATKAPNGLGLYDMSGNVSEWCYDWYQSYPTATYESILKNPKGARFGTHRVSRGGSWLSAPWNCRITSREINTPDVKSSTLGLRLAKGN